MNILCTYHSRCDLPQRSNESIKVNGVEICQEAWLKANEEEREWFKKVTNMYSRGLITKKEFSEYLLSICYHHVDSTIPVFV